MLHAITCGNGAAVSIVDGPADLDLNTLWQEFSSTVLENLSDEPSRIEDLAEWADWSDERDEYLVECYTTLTGQAPEHGEYLQTQLFVATLVKHHDCQEPTVRHFASA